MDPECKLYVSGLPGNMESVQLLHPQPNPWPLHPTPETRNTGPSSQYTKKQQLKITLYPLTKQLKSVFWKQDVDPECNLYVSGLPGNMESAQLRDMFSRYGPDLNPQPSTLNPQPFTLNSKP